MITNKKVLFIGTGFYDYERHIKEQLEERGAIVYYFASDGKSRVKRLLKMVGLHALAISAMSRRLSKYIKEQPDCIDYILMIKADNFQAKHIKQLKEKYPGRKTVVYLWDSIANIENWDLIRANFEHILTFDRKDALENGLFFRPLYYRMIDHKKMSIKYDVSFVAKSYPNRDEIVKKMRVLFNRLGISYNFVLIKTYRRYLWERYITHKITKQDEDLFRFKPMNYNEYLTLSLQSNVIFDVPDSKQNGLTMRTIEAIGMRKKILTTNQDLKYYKDISPDNYRIIDSDNPIIEKSFLTERNEVIYNTLNYSENTFINDIIDYFN